MRTGKPFLAGADALQEKDGRHSDLVGMPAVKGLYVGPYEKQASRI
jgi:hypothetical protein